MSLLALLPILMPQFPTAIINIGMRLMQHPGVIRLDGAIDADAVVAAVPQMVKEDPELAKFGTKIALRGLGVQPAAVDLALDYVFATDGQRTDQERDEFIKNFSSLNSPAGAVYSKLPYGCKQCQRIHYTAEDVQLTADNKPICVRCGRTIILNV